MVKEYKFTTTKETRNMIQEVIEENWDGVGDNKRTYELISESIKNTLKENEGNGFNFNGFYLKDVYLVNNWLEIQKNNKRTKKHILNDSQNLLGYILTNRTSIDISQGIEIDEETFILKTFKYVYERRSCGK